MYVPLKVTTDYTLLKSLIKIDDLITFCMSQKISCCGICDTNLFGAIEFYKKCQKNHIKPIIGLEISIDNYPIYLYAKNYLGYKNLLKINTIICERLININELKQYASNILIIIPYQSIHLKDNLNFFDNIYLGYSQKEELTNVLSLTKNVVYINDLRTFQKEDIVYLNILNKMSDSVKEDIHNYYFDYQKLTKFDFEKILEVTSLLNLEIPFNERYIPKYNPQIDSYQFLSNLCLKGLNKRLNNQVSSKYLERLKYELKVIKKMGFVDYFLIVYDYVLYAKKNNILVGPGRGSAAGSLVSYVIGITDIDPIEYNLLFERFLNYERISMPDIDIDFENTKRDLVIDYVKSKYGHLNVSGGLTYATLKTRLVLREVANILKINEHLLNKFLKVINKDISLKPNYENKTIKEYLKMYPELKKLYHICWHLEGLKKNISTHAAGIVIGNQPLDEIIPMYKNKDVYLTGVAMNYLEDFGLLKMDFLALKNLNTISNIISNIPNFDLTKIPLDDIDVYNLFSQADTDGIFQFETRAFKNMLIKYRPQNFSELVASIALVRPGPSEELETYIKRKNGLESVTYYHENLKPILEETYGVIVYQEQVMSILVCMANFSYAEADNIRKAMSKKDAKLLLKYQESFLKNSTQNGYNISLAQNIYNHILKFALYGFNKSHSVSYAKVSYQMAYLKVHYHSLFMFELLNNSLGSVELIKLYLNDLKKHDLIIEAANINYSENTYKKVNQKVYLPFKLIKNLRSDTINYIIEERNTHGLFENIFDFFKRTYNKLTKNEYLMLINAGCFLGLNYNTKTLVDNLDVLINYGMLYNDLGEYALLPEITASKDYELDILKNNELNSYGFFISNHPASRKTEPNVMKLEKIVENVFKNIECYVMVENVKKIKTKKNEDMAFIDASDETALGDFVLFPKNYNMLQNIKKNDMIRVWGYVTKRYDKYSITINKMTKE